MTKEELISYKEKLSKLSKDEQKLRDLELRKIATGEKQGPITGYASIDKPWLKFFSEQALTKNIPNTNIYDYFMMEAPDDVCLMEYLDRKYYKEDIKREINTYIRRFTSMNIKKGDNVSLVLLNVPEAFFIYVALAKMGAVANMIRPDEGPERIAFMNNERESDYMFISDIPFIVNNVVSSLSEGNNAKEIVMIPEDTDIVLENKKNDERFITYNEWTNKYNGNYYNVINDGFNDVSMVVFTGGTTGNPKAVELTNKNIITGAHSFKYGNYGFEKGKTSLNILPTGIAFNINATYNVMCCGVTVRNIANFEIEKYPELVEEYKPNIVFSGPILLNLMSIKDASEDLSFLENPLSGGDKLLLSEEERINDYLHSRNSNSNIYQGYGMSECTAGATVLKKDAYKLGSVGIPLMNVDVAIFDYDEKEEEKQYGEVGEVCVSGPILMNDYGKSSNKNEVIRVHSDGKTWLHTDDLGYMDEDGHLFLKGRAKRMLTRSGTKVWLSALEDLIKTHENVVDCCCVKMDDKVEREVPVANIVLKDESKLKETCTELDEMITNNQPLTYIPKYYVLRKLIPLTSGNNKVNFKVLENENILDEENYDVEGKICKVLKKTR